MDSILDHILSTVKENVYPIQKKKKKNDLPTYPFWNWWVGAQQTKNILRMASDAAECSADQDAFKASNIELYNFYGPFHS